MRELGRPWKYKDINNFEYTGKPNPSLVPCDKYLVGVEEVGASVEWGGKMFLCRTNSDVEKLYELANRVSFLCIKVKWYALPADYLIEGLPLHEIDTMSDKEWLPMLQQANKTLGFLFSDTSNYQTFFKNQSKNESRSTSEFVYINDSYGF